MALQIVKDIDIDFYDKKYILINAKQYDKNSRYLSVTCYNHGEIYHINAGEHAAYIRYRKPDNYSVFNFCEINQRGKIIIELTEQMLISGGICVADLVIVNKGNADVDVDTGEIITIDNSSILSSMVLHIDVSESPVENSEIESSYEFDGLNTALEKAEAEYKEVIQLAKSYAVGNAEGIRENEDEDNSKYYYELALRSSNSADISEANAQTSANLAKSYANGGTGVRANEDTDNAFYYYTLAKRIIEGLNNGIVPMGTITFAELATAEKVTGFMYNIKDDFVTDKSFAEGAGKSYNAGTNIYCRSDGLWDCFGGAASPIATVDEVKDYLGI